MTNDEEKKKVWIRNDKITTSNHMNVKKSMLKTPRVLGWTRNFYF